MIGSRLQNRRPSRNGVAVATASPNAAWSGRRQARGMISRLRGLAGGAKADGADEGVQDHVRDMPPINTARDRIVAQLPRTEPASQALRAEADGPGRPVATHRRNNPPPDENAGDAQGPRECGAYPTNDTLVASPMLSERADAERLCQRHGPDGRACGDRRRDRLDTQGIWSTISLSKCVRRYQHSISRCGRRGPSNRAPDWYVVE